MKMTCVFRTQLDGRVYKPGDIVDVTADQAKLDSVKAGFKAIDAKAPAPVERIPPGELDAEGYALKLRQARVPFDAGATRLELKELYEKVFAAGPVKNDAPVVPVEAPVVEEAPAEAPLFSVEEESTAVEEAPAEEEKPKGKKGGKK